MQELEKSDKEVPFELLLKKLEQVVSQLEGGDLSLESSLRAYEKGVALVRMSEERLKGMESKIEELLADGKKRPMEFSTLEEAVG